MNKRSKSRTFLIDLLLVAILISVLVIILNSRSVLANLASSTATPPPNLVQASATYCLACKERPAFTAEPSVFPAKYETPNPTPIVTDLFPQLPNDEKREVYIQHENGVVEMFLIKIDSPTTGTVPLQPGDRILIEMPDPSGELTAVAKFPTWEPASSTPVFPPEKSTLSPINTPTP